MYHFEKVPPKIQSQKSRKYMLEVQANATVIVDAIIQFCKAVFVESNYRDPVVR
jgi:hypothetical protein